MAEVTLTLTVHQGEHLGSAGGDRIWQRTYDTPFLPDEGDDVAISRHEDDALDGIQWPVKRRWWGHDGSVLIELVGAHLDPSPQIEKSCDRRYRVAWHRSIEGSDLNDVLAANGWTEWRP